MCPTYKEFFQARWDNSIPLFSPSCHLPWSISILLNQSECIFLRNSREQMILCAMLQSSIAHSIICTWLFRRKMHSDWFNGIEILQGRWQHGERKWDTVIPTDLKRLFVSGTYMSRWSRKGYKIQWVTRQSHQNFDWSKKYFVTFNSGISTYMQSTKVKLSKPHTLIRDATWK